MKPITASSHIFRVFIGPSWTRDLTIQDKDQCFLLKSENISISDLIEIFPNECASVHMMMSKDIFPITLTSQGWTHFVIAVTHSYQSNITETKKQQGDADFQFDVISFIIGLIVPTIILVLTVWNMMYYRTQFLRMKRHVALSAHANPNQGITDATAQYEMAQFATTSVMETAYTNHNLNPINAGGNMMCGDDSYEDLDGNDAGVNTYEIYSN
ncbi:uncharacterized protein LOC144425715 [Styela clava]